MRLRFLSICGLFAMMASAWAEPSPAPHSTRSLEIKVEFYEAPSALVHFLIPDGTLPPTPPPPTDPNLPSGLMHLAGVFTVEQLALVLKDFRNNKNVETVSSPPLFARSGSKAIFKQVQEVLYATEYDQGKKPGDAPVATKFEHKDVGIKIEATPTLGPDNTTIDLALSLSTCHLIGYMTLDGKTILFQRGGRLSDLLGAIPEEYPGSDSVQPSFASREITTQVTVNDGNTVVLGGLKRKDDATGTDRSTFILVTARVLP